MKRYSYLVGGLGLEWKAEDEQSQLNEMGQRGWELVAVVVKQVNGAACTVFYFRRECPHDDAEQNSPQKPAEIKDK